MRWYLLYLSMLFLFICSTLYYIYQTPFPEAPEKTDENSKVLTTP